MQASDDPPPNGALHDEAAAWLARLRGPPSADVHAAFEAWYAANPRHAAAYDSVLESWDATHLVAATPVGQARTAHSRVHSRRRRFAIAAVAASIVVILLAYGAYGAVVTSGDPAGRVEFASDANGPRTVELADGSQVTLDSASRIEVAYSASERRVFLLSGRARFTVEHERARPFIVSTHVGEVIDRGTIFEVALNGDAATVSLVKGSVEIRPSATGGRPSSSRVLSPGQRVVMRAGQTPTAAPPNVGDARHRMVSFENAPLADVVASANHGGSEPVVLADPALAQLRFTGSFDASDTEQLARMLAAAFALDVSRSEEGSFVLSRPGSNPRK